jgi:cytoplasmic tRNA 2-thiolation protein 2
MTAGTVDQICKRCSVNQAALIVRSEPLCAACLAAYLTVKVSKRMEAFRTRYGTAGQERKLLLPMSFGVSSCSLLELLDRHLRVQQERTQMKGFSLHVVHIDQSSITREASDASRMEALKERFPEHAYSVIPLSSVFKKESTQTGHSSSPNAGADDSENTIRFLEFLAAMPSATSQSDIISLFLTRALVQFATENSCEAILWGDSTTKLAERVLSESAKGRGFSLPWQVADGETPYGVSFYYPLRDILKKELMAFVGLTSPPLTPLLTEMSFVATQAPVSSRNTTIDMLMKQYFESVEESYPSIVSNVVRTSSRLRPLSVGTQRCKLCMLPVTKDQLGIESWEGNQDNDEPLDDHLGLCYGCSRTMNLEAVVLLP